MFILKFPHLSDEGTELWLKHEPMCIFLEAAGEPHPCGQRVGFCGNNHYNTQLSWKRGSF